MFSDELREDDFHCGGRKTFTFIDDVTKDTGHHMFDILVQSWRTQVEECFKVRGNQVGRGISEIADNDNTFCGLQNLKKMHCIREICIVRRFKALELFQKQFEGILQSKHGG